MAGSSVNVSSSEAAIATLASRGHGLGDAEIRRVTKTLARLRLTAAEAKARRPARADDFGRTLRALADV